MKFSLQMEKLSLLKKNPNRPMWMKIISCGSLLCGTDDWNLAKFFGKFIFGSRYIIYVGRLSSSVVGYHLEWLSIIRSR
jgi:hypothetical protein